jgi:hypothetical protein
VVHCFCSGNDHFPENPVSEAFKQDAAKGRLLVMRGDKMVGMITQTGLLRFLEIKHALAS